ncbi:MAG: YciI family protein [Vicinamibacterales bacterium]
MPKYMLLLHDNPASFEGVSPDEMQKIVEKYIVWGKKLREAGVWRASDKLTDEPGRVMRRKDGQVRVTDGPYSESKEVLGGYYLIEVGSYDNAVEHARDCPHLEYGGTIEVRQVDKM